MNCSLPKNNKGSYHKTRTPNYKKTFRVFQNIASCQKKIIKDGKNRVKTFLMKSSNKQQKQQNKEIKKKSSGFPLKKIIFLLLVVLGGLIYVDVKNNGSWKDSRTALLLKEYKVCEYSHQVLNKTKGGINWVNSEIDKKFPGYEKNLHETLEPYLQVASDFGVLIKNAACDFKDRMIVYYNVVVAKIEKEAPSFSEKIKEMFGEKFSIEKISNVMIEGLTFIQKEVTEFCVVVWNKIRTFTT